MWASSKASAKAKAAFSATSRHYTSSTHPTLPNGKHAARSEEPGTQRELFLNVLNASATRRDAKQYLSRFKQPKKSKSGPKPDLYTLLEERNARNRNDQQRLDSTGVNLGALYTPSRAIADAPQFAQHEVVREQQPQPLPPQEPLHVALTCLKSPEKIDDATIDGLARTLSQLVRLDMRIVLVLDASSHDARRSDDVRALRRLLAEQADRVCDAIDRHNPEGGRPVLNALEVADEDADVHVTLPNLILDPVKRGMVAIVPSLAYTATGQVVPVSVSDVMAGLTKHLIGQDELSHHPKDDTAEDVSLDRIILIDPVGGIPSRERGNGAHVFINLDQEFDPIAQELSDYAADAMETEESFFLHTVYEQHQGNLEMVRNCLELLPSASSALIVTPEEAASSSQASQSSLPSLGTGTRRQKNPLIHNLLTNKPLVSSSLPRARFTNPDAPANEGLTAATVLRRGMPLKIIPAAARSTGWVRPKNGISPLDLRKDPRVSLRRLVHLIEDSFRRKLNVEDYLNRIHGRLAGVIVAGDYEGGAILTWELPPGVTDPSRMVPYLDKFAVLQTSQGSSGVADIVFQAMVRSCFPHGVCWRSRKNNPVNKWYFERSAGTWQIPDSNWTMFWTGEDVVDNEQRWKDYVAVCSNIQASWDDVTRKPD